MNQFSTILLMFSCLFIQVFVQAQNNPLAIPETLSGENIELFMSADSVQFLSGQKTATKGFNGAYFGPTLILQKGDSIHFKVHNNLEETTTVHWHGLHVPPNADGGPHTPIAAGTIWEPSIKLYDEAGTSWYHPHLHGTTTDQVLSGLAGMIITRDESDVQELLPKTYGVDEFPLILNYQGFDENNQITRGGTAIPMINGTMNPELDVPAQMIRFHLLNGDESTEVNLSMANGDDLIVIATEGGLLESPVSMQTLPIYTGERYEIVLNLSAYEGQTVYLKNTVTASMGMGMGMGTATSTEYNEYLKLNVVAPTTDAVTSLPSEFTTYEIWDELEADVTRVKRFTGMGANFSINDIQFQHSVVNDTVYLNDIEIWEIRNETRELHPFHIHDEQFFILDINGIAPEPFMAGPKDVVVVNPDEVVRFITRFEDFTDMHIPYMYHCHILPHEDNGMMGSFIVIEREETVETTSVNNLQLQSFVNMYPNPANEQILVEFNDIPNLQDYTLSILNHFGQEIQTKSSLSDAMVLNVQNWNGKGMYFINLLDIDGSIQAVHKVMVQ